MYFRPMDDPRYMKKTIEAKVGEPFSIERSYGVGTLTVRHPYPEWLTVVKKELFHSPTGYRERYEFIPKREGYYRIDIVHENRAERVEDDGPINYADVYTIVVRR